MPHTVPPRLETLEDRLTPSASWIDDLVVFGDSLSDKGNHAWAPINDGAFWVDTLAEYLGEDPTVASSDGGLNYAHVGAAVTIPQEYSPEIYDAPSVGEQIAAYLEENTDNHRNEVFAIWAGSNDFFFLFQGGAITDLASAQATAQAVAEALAADIATLIDSGGRRFVVVNVSPLGDTPYMQDLAGGAYAGLANYWSAQFNIALEEELDELDAKPGVMISEADATLVFTTLSAELTEDELFLPDDFHPRTVAQQTVGLYAAADFLSDHHVQSLTVSIAADGVDPTDGGLSLEEALNIIGLMPGHQRIHFAIAGHHCRGR